MKVGVLALQGAFREHREVLDALGVDAIEVRAPDHLSGVDAVVLPGGESTTMNRLLGTSRLFEPLRELTERGTPVLGTCAGMILLAHEVLDGRPDQRTFDAIDLDVRRNGYGRQLESFEDSLEVDGLTGGPFPGVFIRAPVVERAGAGVEVLARHAGRPVLARQGRIWVTSFHPELSGDLRLHQRFLNEASST